MIKKFGGLFIIIFIAVLIIIGAPTFAAQLQINGAEEVYTLNDAILEVDSYPDYILVIGKYAFTSNYIVTTQDVMLAARSIEVTENNKAGKTIKDGIYNEMAIQKLLPEYDESWQKVIGLKYNDNLAGDTKLGSIVDIEYVNYTPVVPKAKVDVEALVNNAFTALEKEYDEFAITKTTEENTYNIEADSRVELKGLVQKVLDEIKAPSKESAIKNFVKEALNTDGVKEVVIKDGAGAEVCKLERSKFIDGTGKINEDELIEAAKDIIKAIFGIQKADIKLEDLEGITLDVLKDKTYSLEVKLDENAITMDGTASAFKVYKVKFDIIRKISNSTLENWGKASTDKINKKGVYNVSTNGNVVTVKYARSEIDNTISDTLIDNSTIFGGNGTGLKDGIESFLNREEIESMTIYFGDQHADVTYDAIHNTSNYGLAMYLYEIFGPAVESATGTVINNVTHRQLNGVSINIKINLTKPNVWENDNLGIFTIQFAQQ